MEGVKDRQIDRQKERERERENKRHNQAHACTWNKAYGQKGKRDACTQVAGACTMPSLTVKYKKEAWDAKRRTPEAVPVTTTWWQ